MSIVEQYGFDALFNQLVEMWPEVRLHVVRKDQKTIVSLQALNESAIVIGRPEEDVGSCVRRTIADLHTRLVVADKRREEQDAELETVYNQVETLYNRASELREIAETLNDEINDCLDRYNDFMSERRFAEALPALAKVEELTPRFQAAVEELDRVEAELDGLDPEFEIRDSL